MSFKPRQTGVRSFAAPLHDAVPPAERAAMREGAAELLTWLREHGIRIGLISNSIWPGDAHRDDLERFGLLGFFDTTTFSSECGLWKPDPRVFATTLQQLGATPEGS